MHDCRHDCYYSCTIAITEEAARGIALAKDLWACLYECQGAVEFVKQHEEAMYSKGVSCFVIFKCFLSLCMSW